MALNGIKDVIVKVLEDVRSFHIVPPSKIMTGQGSVYEYTFTEEIVFKYICLIHPASMFGALTVVKYE